MNTIQNVSTIEIGQDGYLKVTTETSDTIRGDQSSDVSMLRSDETVIWGKKWVTKEVFQIQITQMFLLKK